MFEGEEVVAGAKLRRRQALCRHPWCTKINLRERAEQECCAGPEHSAGPATNQKSPKFATAAAVPDGVNSPQPPQRIDILSESFEILSRA